MILAQSQVSACMAHYCTCTEVPSRGHTGSTSPASPRSSSRRPSQRVWMRQSCAPSPPRSASRCVPCCAVAACNQPCSQRWPLLGFLHSSDTDPVRMQEWMLDFRLKAYRRWLTMAEPEWSDNRCAIPACRSPQRTAWCMQPSPQHECHCMALKLWGSTGECAGTRRSTSRTSATTRRPSRRARR